MNNLCLFTSLSSSAVAAWAQAIVGAIAMIVGALAVFHQVKRNRMELSERESRMHDGLARLLIHLKDCAIEARAEKKKVVRWPVGHPAEPSSRFKELAEAIRRYPLDAIHAELPFEALLNAQRAATEMWPLVDTEPELTIDQNFETVFQSYIALLEDQVLLLRAEAVRLLKGERARHAAAVKQ
jgi:hypothetical protein